MNEKSVRGGTNGPVAEDVPLILTKIQVPRRRPDLVPRRRLVDFLHAQLDRRLILISAPAGFGKTSLLADFAHDTDLPVCWYTLDRFDCDLRTFLESFIAAIARRFPAFGQRARAFLREVQDPGRQLYPLVAALVQDLYEAIDEYFVLVLDDHHTVQDQEQIAEFLDLLLTYVDENFHLILSSRELPALPNLALLVARRQAAGLGVDELRFTPQEIQALAQRNYGRELTEEQAGQLAERTGGWITGLLLTAAPQWQRGEGAGDRLPILGQIGVDLYDYLSRQVLEQQPAALRDFLLASSVLDELSPALCKDVLDIEQPDLLLAQVRARNLFVTEFEGDGDRLRYHDLFREFLQATLRRQDPARFRELVRRAAKVYAAQGRWEQAVSRYLDLHEYERVSDIVERLATDFFESGRWDTLASWIDALPDEILADRPRFLVQRAKIYGSRGDMDRAAILYEQAGQRFAAMGDRGGTALAKALQGYVLGYQGRYAQGVAHCREALALVTGETEQEKFTLALAHKNIGLCLLRMGQLAEGQAALRQALHLYEAVGGLHDVGMVHHDLALSYELAGELGRAVDHYRAALQRWQELGNLAPWANTLNGLGVVYHLQGRYEEALQMLQQALAKAQQIGYLRVESLAWASLGDLHRDLGRYRQARESYTEALRAATRADEGFVVTYALAGQGDVARLQGNLGQAREQLQEAMAHAQGHNSTYEAGLCHMALGVLAGEEGDLPAARDHLDQAVEVLKAGGYQRDLARAYLHRSHTAFLAGDLEQALADLEQALLLADRLGLARLLAVEGQAMRPLLRHAARQGIGGDAVPRLLARIQEHQARVASIQRGDQIAELAEQPEPVEPVLKLYGLGFPYVEKGGVTVQWATLQSRDLLFCLLQHPRGLSKEQVGTLFWPDHTPHKLHNVFRSSLYRLRRALSAEIVVFQEERYCFNREAGYWFDVEAFEDLLGRATREERAGQQIVLLEEALALYRGDYLAGMDADWVSLEREWLSGQHLAALEKLARLHVDGGDLDRAIELYRRLLAQDPYRESAHRGLMTCFHLQGDRAAWVATK